MARAEQRTQFGRSGIYDVTVYRNGEPPEVIAEFRGRSRIIRDSAER
jgi:acyl-CoA thioesterase